MLLIIMNSKIWICLLYLLFGSVFAEKMKFGNSFSCGKLFYHSMSYIEKYDQLLVGSMDWVFRPNMTNFNLTSCENGVDALNLKAQSIEKCSKNIMPVDYHCRNHIRIIQKWSEDDTVYFCETNAYDPTVFSIELQKSIKPMKDLSLKNHSLRAQTGRCPFSPDANYTAAEMDGNLFVGSGKDVSESIIAYSRHALNADNVKKVKKAYITTETKEAVYLYQDPHFVTSFIFAHFNIHQIYVIFREIAHEKERLDRPDGFYMSRIAAVCSIDEGVEEGDHKRWGSFIKASMNCSTGDINYNEVQDAVTVDLRYRFYAVFTRQNTQESAVCLFDMTKNLKIFKGPFKKDISRRNSIPLELHLTSERHPFDCPKEKEKNVRFISHPPMMERSFNVLPLYVTKKDTLTKIAYIKIWGRIQSRDFNIYVGTTKGEIHQIIWNRIFNRTFYYLAYYVFNIIELVPPEPIRAMIFNEKQRTLYVSSDSAVHQFDLTQCERYSCLKCIRDALCSWDREINKCVFGGSGSFESPISYFSNFCEKAIKMHFDIITFGVKNRIKCKSVFAVNETVFPAKIFKETVKYHSKEGINWYQCDDANSDKLINCKNTDKYKCENFALIIKSVDEVDEGCYKCILVDATLYSVTMTISYTQTESLVAISGQTLKTKCNNSVIQKVKISANDISWFPCGDLNNKKLENKNKYSRKDYSFSILSVSDQDTGCYACVKEKNVLYRLNLAVIIPQHYIATVGSIARLVCKSSSYQTIDIVVEDIVWFKTKDQQNFTKIEKSNKFSFEENNTLNIAAVDNQDKGFYNCKIKEANIYSYELKIVSIIPELYILKYGSTANLVCKDSHIKIDASADVVWLKSSNLENFTKIEAKKNKIIKSKNHKLIIKDVDNHDEQYYYCRSKEMNVYGYNVKVVIPLEVPRLKVVNVGQPAYLECNNILFDKIDVLSKNIKWYKCDNNKAIATGTQKYSFENYRLTISSTNKQDEGCYNCNLNETMLRKIELLIADITSKIYNVDLGRKTKIVCNNPIIRKASIPAKHITWHRCNDAQNITKLKTDRTKSFRNYDLVILSTQKEDLGCYTCKSEEVTLHIANLTIFRQKLKYRSGCEKKNMSWKYIFFMHVFIMVLKNLI